METSLCQLTPHLQQWPVIPAVLSTTTKFGHKQGDCSAPSLVLQGSTVPEHVSEFARAVPLTYTPLLIPPDPMMRTRSWSLFLRLMTKLPIWPWESHILTITVFSLLFKYHLPHYIHQIMARSLDFLHSPRHKSFLFWTNNCKMLCSTFPMTWTPQLYHVFPPPTSQQQSQENQEGSKPNLTEMRNRGSAVSSSSSGIWSLHYATWHASYPHSNAILGTMN